MRQTCPKGVQKYTTLGGEGDPLEIMKETDIDPTTKRIYTNQNPF